MKTTTQTIPGAGVILFRFRSESCEPEFLLLKGRDTGVWSFPKGHPEAADNGEALQTAIRETYEETGYIYGEDYHICGGSIRFGKRPYWVGYLSSTKLPRLTAREHARYAWFTKAELESGRSEIQANLDVRGWLRRSSTAFQEAIRSWSVVEPVPSIQIASSEMPDTHSIDEDNIVTLT
jgi:8-oxo-dGTP pyrophosphatase MutT (NUDIX family)